MGQWKYYSRNITIGFLLLTFLSLCTFQASFLSQYQPVGDNATLRPHTIPPTTRMTVLYIITSSNAYYSNRRDRVTEIMIPVLLDGVASLRQDYDVDVYLILGYNLSTAHLTSLQQALPNSVGLEIWNDACPYTYECDPDQGMCRPPPLNNASDRRTMVPRNQSAIRSRGPTLARQHRFVIKDKLPYYDFFMAYEDDMRVTKHHVHQHLSIMNELRRLQTMAPPELNDTTATSPTRNEYWGILSKRQLERMRPGFIRVEVFHPNNTRGTQLQLDPIPISNGTLNSVDPTACCHTTHVGGSPQRPLAKDLLLWESGVWGTSVRLMPESSIWDWVVLLPGPWEKFPTGIPSYWSGRAMNWSQLSAMNLSDMRNPKPHHVLVDNPKFLAQPAGWMASRDEIMEYHQKLCVAGILPPFDGNDYPWDGLHYLNVEFWSGGLQFWLKHCNIQRIILVDETFGNHLLYHTEVKKQYTIPQQRLVRVVDYFRQLQTVIQVARGEREQALGSQARQNDGLSNTTSLVA